MSLNLRLGGNTMYTIRGLLAAAWLSLVYTNEYVHLYASDVLKWLSAIECVCVALSSVFVPY